MDPIGVTSPDVVHMGDCTSSDERGNSPAPPVLTPERPVGQYSSTPRATGPPTLFPVTSGLHPRIIQSSGYFTGPRLNALPLFNPATPLSSVRPYLPPQRREIPYGASYIGSRGPSAGLGRGPAPPLITRTPSTPPGLFREPSASREESTAAVRVSPSRPPPGFEAVQPCPVGNPVGGFEDNLNDLNVSDSDESTDESSAPVRSPTRPRDNSDIHAEVIQTRIAVDRIAAAMDTFQNSVNSLNSRLTDVFNNLSANIRNETSLVNNQVELLKITVDSALTRITDLESGGDGRGQRLADVEGRLTEFSSSLAEVRTAVAGLQLTPPPVSIPDDDNDRVAGVENQVALNETNIKALLVRIGNLEHQQLSSAVETVSHNYHAQRGQPAGPRLPPPVPAGHLARPPSGDPPRSPPPLPPQHSPSVPPPVRPQPVLPVGPPPRPPDDRPPFRPDDGPRDRFYTPPPFRSQHSTPRSAPAHANPSANHNQPPYHPRGPSNHLASGSNPSFGHRNDSTCQPDGMSRRDIVKKFEHMDKFKGDGEMSWKTFIGYFEKACLKCRCSTELKLELLADRLSGQAAEYYVALPTPVQDDYDSLKSSLQKRFESGANVRSIRQKLRSLRQKSTESIQEYSQRVRLVIRDLPNPQDPANEALAVDTFLEGVTNTSAALLVMEKNHTSLERAVESLDQTITNQQILVAEKRARQVEPEPDPSTCVRQVHAPSGYRSPGRDRGRYQSPGRIRDRYQSPRRPDGRSQSPYRGWIRQNSQSPRRDYRNQYGNNFRNRSPSDRSRSPTDYVRSRYDTHQRNHSPALSVASQDLQNAVEQVLRKLASNTSGPPVSQDPDACYACGHRGHFARECPTRNRGRSPSPAPPLPPTPILRTDDTRSSRPGRSVAFDRNPSNPQGSA